MTRPALFASLAAVACCSAAWAEEPCPKFGPGMPYPWEPTDVMPGDQWAWMELDLNERGRVDECRIGETNIHNKNRLFYICNSYKKSWYTDPVVRDGKAVKTTVRHKFIVIGSRHEKANAEARAEYFRTHPEISPKCFPKYGR